MNPTLDPTELLDDTFEENSLDIVPTQMFRFPENPGNGDDYTAQEFLKEWARIQKPSPFMTGDRFVHPFDPKEQERVQVQIKSIRDLPLGVLPCTLKEVKVLLTKEVGYWKYDQKTGNPKNSNFKEDTILLKVKVEHGDKKKDMEFKTTCPEWLVSGRDGLLKVVGQEVRILNVIEKGRKRLSFILKDEQFDHEKPMTIPDA